MGHRLDVLAELADTVAARRNAAPDISYTAKLLSQGIEKCAKKVGNTGKVYGIDISSKMLNRARRSIRDCDLSEKTDLVLGDASEEPFLESSFDVIFSSYVLDLIDTPTIPRILSEFKRLLKPGGRVILVSLTKGSKWFDNMKLYEWIYARSPSLLGGCRPITLARYLQQSGFRHIGKKFVRAGFLMPTEIAWADKE
jgi:demethylmenaquinone methyltransferase/2-methoxy-6-polyprenyl-1,4-benzoquinol methylase